VWINAVLAALAVAAALLGRRPYGIALWLVVASIGAANGAFHLWATLRGRRYSPGVATGALVYLPLAVWGFWHFAANGSATTSMLVQAAVIGPAYHVYAAWNHRRRAARMSAAGA
jgi:hypothetical protein